MGWDLNKRVLYSKKLSGECSETHRAAFAALEENVFGEPRPSRNERACISTVAIPEATQFLICSLFGSSNKAQIGHW